MALVESKEIVALTEPTSDAMTALAPRDIIADT